MDHVHSIFLDWIHIVEIENNNNNNNNNHNKDIIKLFKLLFFFTILNTIEM